jgi:hypothetical protein
MADGKETARSLAEARKRWPKSAVEKTEHWDAFAPRRDGGRGKRRDLFGFGDMIVAGEDSGHILIQSTTKGCMAARRRKILGARQAHEKNTSKQAEYRVRCFLAWLASGGRVLIWGWHQPGGPGTRHILEEREVTREDAERFNDR